MGENTKMYSEMNEVETGKASAGVSIETLIEITRKLELEVNEIIKTNNVTNKTVKLFTLVVTEYRRLMDKPIGDIDKVINIYEEILSNGCLLGNKFSKLVGVSLSDILDTENQEMRNLVMFDRPDVAIYDALMLLGDFEEAYDGFIMQNYLLSSVVKSFLVKANDIYFCSVTNKSRVLCKELWLWCSMFQETLDVFDEKYRECAMLRDKIASLMLVNDVVTEGDE